MRTKQAPEYPQIALSYPSPIFAEAILDDSNWELDWLWLADEVSCPIEREYCLRRALYINPNSREAQRKLERLLQSRKAKLNFSDHLLRLVEAIMACLRQLANLKAMSYLGEISDPQEKYSNH